MILPSDDLGWVGYLILGIWIINGVLVSFLLTSIDSIVNGQLYGYGLQFSQEWAEPYWTNLHLIYVFLGLPMVLSLIVFGFAFVRVKKHKFGYIIRRRKKPLEVFVEQPEAKVECGAEQEVLVEQEPGIVKEEAFEEPKRLEAAPVRASKEKIEGKESDAVVISCPSCSKFFSRPLIMLDFSSGKTRLVNICPYCNHKLGEVQERREEEY